eukprot:scaffold3060_cov121-Isochrysis_galbana.AAC.5
MGVYGAENVVDLKEDLARPIEAEGWPHQGEDVEMPDEFLSGGGNERMSPSGVFILRFSRLPLSILRPTRLHAAS